MQRPQLYRTTDQLVGIPPRLGRGRELGGKPDAGNEGERSGCVPAPRRFQTLGLQRAPQGCQRRGAKLGQRQYRKLQGSAFEDETHVAYWVSQRLAQWFNSRANGAQQAFRKCFARRDVRPSSVYLQIAEAM